MRNEAESEVGDSSFPRFGLSAPVPKRASVAPSMRHVMRLALRSQCGASLVEMALSIMLILVVLFGIIQVCFALYAYNCVSDAAREATRYAIVRGSFSCLISPTFPNCNIGPTTAGNPIQTYVRNLGFPMANSMNATATWWAASVDSNGHTTWTTPCTTKLDGNNNSCNQPGNQVRVVVTYAFPLDVPFWQNSTLNLHSTSQMMINF